MKKNKYDLTEDVSWMLYEIKNCKSCFMKKECRSNPDEERALCSNVAKLTKAIEDKYLR